MKLCADCKYLANTEDVDPCKSCGTSKKNFELETEIYTGDIIDEQHVNKPRRTNLFSIEPYDIHELSEEVL